MAEHVHVEFIANPNPPDHSGVIFTTERGWDFLSDLRRRARWLADVDRTRCGDRVLYRIVEVCDD